MLCDGLQIIQGVFTGSQCLFWGSIVFEMLCKLLSLLWCFVDRQLWIKLVRISLMVSRCSMILTRLISRWHWIASLVAVCCVTVFLSCSSWHYQCHTIISSFKYSVHFIPLITGWGWTILKSLFDDVGRHSVYQNV